MTDLTVTEAISRVRRGSHDDTWIDLGIDPAATERIGAEIAALLRTVGVDLVISWDGEDDVVLAHVTARHLGVPRVVAYEESGLLTTSRSGHAGRAALVSTRLSRTRPVAAVRGLLESQGVELAVAVELLPSLPDRYTAGSATPTTPIITLTEVG